MHVIIQDDYLEGDKYDIGDISDATGVALGRKAAATVTNRGKRTDQDG